MTTPPEIKPLQILPLYNRESYFIGYKYDNTSIELKTPIKPLQADSIKWAFSRYSTYSIGYIGYIQLNDIIPYYLGWVDRPAPFVSRTNIKAGNYYEKVTSTTYYKTTYVNSDDGKSVVLNGNIKYYHGLSINIKDADKSSTSPESMVRLEIEYKMGLPYKVEGAIYSYRDDDSRSWLSIEYTHQLIDGVQTAVMSTFKFMVTDKAMYDNHHTSDGGRVMNTNCFNNYCFDGIQQRINYRFMLKASYVNVVNGYVTSYDLYDRVGTLHNNKVKFEDFDKLQININNFAALSVGGFMLYNSVDKDRRLMESTFFDFTGRHNGVYIFRLSSHDAYDIKFFWHGKSITYQTYLSNLSDDGKQLRKQLQVVSLDHKITGITDIITSYAGSENSDGLSEHYRKLRDTVVIGIEDKEFDDIQSILKVRATE